MLKKALSLFVIVSLIGCTSERTGGYVSQENDVYGHPSELGYTQKSRAIVEIVEKLLTDPTFSRMYADARSRAVQKGRKLPTIAILPLEDNSGPGSNDSETTSQIYRELQTVLRKTEKFKIIDYAMRKELIGVVVRAGDLGEKPEGVQDIGNYSSSDFILRGELRRESTRSRNGKVYHHFLNLDMKDTQSGEQAWSDTIRIFKQ